VARRFSDEHNVRIVDNQSCTKRSSSSSSPPQANTDSSIDTANNNNNNQIKDSITKELRDLQQYIGMNKHLADETILSRVSFDLPQLLNLN
jgi:hypothetical protein